MCARFDKIAHLHAQELGAFGGGAFLGQIGLSTGVARAEGGLFGGDLEGGEGYFEIWPDNQIFVP